MQAGGETAWSVRHAIGILAGTTLAVAMMSELLVRAIEPAAERLGLTQVFVGVIRVALAGTAAEHGTAVLAAMKNNMDLALGIVLGSSLRIALVVAPVLVFASYLCSRPLDPV
jgi:Ca2+:H+ antiporter